jgi:hypothetical protein
MTPVKPTFLTILRWILDGFGLLFILVFALRIYEDVRYSRLLPPPEIRNIQDFRRWNPSFGKAQMVTFHGSTYYAVRGPRARALASGPSEYYFDHNGNYVGRNVDTGDHYEPAIFSAKDAERKPIEINNIPSVSR